MELHVLRNVETCHACVREGRAAVGAVACPVDGGAIVAHAQAHDCPRERFPSRGLGDTVAKVTHAIGIKKCCGCGGRQVVLNRLLSYRESAD